MTNEEVKDWLIDSFESGAEWRERKAAEYPDDRRNMDAHRAHISLRDSVTNIPDTLISSYVGVRERLDSCRVGEIEGEAFRAVGFYSAPGSATTFLQSLAAELRRAAGLDLRSPGPASAARH